MSNNKLEAVFSNVTNTKETPDVIHENIKQTPVHVYPDGRVDTLNAARYTGYAEKTLAMKRNSGTGPPFVKRGKVFYYIEDLVAWLQGHGKVLTTAQARIQAKQAAADELKIATGRKRKGLA